jgi:hypothetical protein
MKLLDYILIEPRYKWTDEKGEFVKPSSGEILSEFFYRMNFIRDSKNWFPFFAWFLVLILVPVFLIFIGFDGEPWHHVVSSIFDAQCICF